MHGPRANETRGQSSSQVYGEELFCLLERAAAEGQSYLDFDSSARLSPLMYAVCRSLREIRYTQDLTTRRMMELMSWQESLGILGGVARIR